MVRVKVRIPRIDGDPLKGLPQQIVNKFKVLPVPEYLKGFYAGDHLFSDAEVKSEITGEDSYWYINNTTVDDRTGTFRKIQDEKKISVRVVTFECVFSTGSNVVPAAAPAAN